MGQRHNRRPNSTCDCQYLFIWHIVSGIHLSETSDRFIWRWEPSGTYSARSAYRCFFIWQTEVLGARQLWKTRAPNKCRFFFWLLIHNRCWTSERLQRHNLHNNGPCTLCSQLSEHIDHLVLGCVFSREVWHRGLSRFGWQQFNRSSDAQMIPWWLQVRKGVCKQ